MYIRAENEWFQFIPDNNDILGRPKIMSSEY